MKSKNKCSSVDTQTFRSIRNSNESCPEPNNYVPEPIEGIDFESIISLPPEEDLQEWLAYNVFDFHRQVSMLFSTISEYCTCQTCPKMTAGPGFKYLWSEHDSHTEMPAPEYIWRLLNQIENQLDDENIFPSTLDRPFPTDVMSVIKTIMKRLFRVYAHFYHHHINHFKQLTVGKELDTSFIHFIRFNKKYNLISPQQLEPLQDLILKIFN